MRRQLIPSTWTIQSVPVPLITSTVKWPTNEHYKSGRVELPETNVWYSPWETQACKYQTGDVHELKRELASFGLCVSPDF